MDWADKYDVGISWQGTKREEFETNKTDAKTSGDTYCGLVDDACAELEAEKARCEAALGEGESSLASKRTILNSLQTPNLETYANNSSSR